MKTTPKELNVKLILGGSARSGKSTFINDISLKINDDNVNQIGISFKLIVCVVKDYEYCNYLVWDLNASNQFKFLYPRFCQGASGVLLCFDISDNDSFNELPNWIRYYRNLKTQSQKKIPILLLATKCDLEHRVSNDKIQDLMQKYELKEIFFVSIKDLKSKREEIFKILTEKLNFFGTFSKFSIVLPGEDIRFTTFLKIFSRCPICNKNNHLENLKALYYNKNPEITKLKDQLINLFDDLSHIERSGKGRVIIGIPCCSCYKTYYGENRELLYR